MIPHGGGSMWFMRNARMRGTIRFFKAGNHRNRGLGYLHCPQAMRIREGNPQDCLRASAPIKE
jgi:hypothetical protein